MCVTEINWLSPDFHIISQGRWQDISAPAKQELPSSEVESHTGVWTLNYAR